MAGPFASRLGGVDRLELVDNEGRECMMSLDFVIG